MKIDENVADSAAIRNSADRNSGQNIIELWDKVFSCYSFNNPEYGRACLHLTMGALFRDCRIQRSGVSTDPRISIMYLKPSFSGGSAGYDMVAVIFEGLGLLANKLTDASDTALIGSIEWKEDEKGGAVPVVRKGLLDKEKSHLIYWGEASILFNKKLPPYQQKLMNYIQAGLNPIDSEESKLKRELKDGSITCNVETSVLMVTYPPKELDDGILMSGFIQRVFLIPKTLDLDGRYENICDDIDRYFNGFDTKGNIRIIINTLKEIRAKYPEGTKFTIDPDASDCFKQMEKEMLEPFKKTNERIQQHVGSILASTVRKVVAVSTHHLMLTNPGSTVITVDNLKYAFDVIVKPQIEMIHQYLEERPEQEEFADKDDGKIKKIIDRCLIIFENTPVPKKVFLDMVVGKALNVSSGRSKYSWYKKLMDRGFIEEVGEGQKTTVKIAKAIR